MVDVTTLSPDRLATQLGRVLEVDAAGVGYLDGSEVTKEQGCEGRKEMSELRAERGGEESFPNGHSVAGIGMLSYLGENRSGAK